MRARGTTTTKGSAVYLSRKGLLSGALIAISMVFGPAAVATTPIEAFARLPVLAALSISPDGKYIAAKVNTKGEYTVAVFEVKGNQIDAKFKATVDDMQPQWTKWASPTRVLISSGAATNRFGTPVYETRLSAINFDGSKQRVMIRDDNSTNFFVTTVQFQDNVIDYLPNDPDHIIMSYNKDDPARPKPHRVDVHSGKGKSLVGGREYLNRWMTDRNGVVRIGSGRKENGVTIVETRDSAGGDWRQIHSATVASGRTFYPMGFSPDPDIVYVVSNHEGPTTGLYEYHLSTQSFGKKLHRHAEVDIQSAWMNEATGKLRRSTIWLNGPQYEWYDPKAKAISQKLESAFSDQTITLIDTSTDDRVWIALISSDTNPGQYIVYNSASNNAVSLGPTYPELANVKLSPTIAFDYNARDGLKIPAFITLPQAVTSIEQARNLPLVVMPHGGPQSREYAGFDPWVQMIADRGIAVLQMNFRGSAGFGSTFSTAGYGQWGGKMQDDVTDGANYLIAEGIADPNRICIFGGSYGGYAALMGAVKTPDLYKCAVGWNGVYDLDKMMDEARHYIRGGGLGYWETAIGDHSNTKFLDSISPAERASEIKFPSS